MYVKELLHLVMLALIVGLLFLATLAPS